MDYMNDSKTSLKKTSNNILCSSFSSSNINYETITAIISTVLPLTTIIFLLMGEY